MGLMGLWLVEVVVLRRAAAGGHVDAPLPLDTAPAHVSLSSISLNGESLRLQSTDELRRCGCIVDEVLSPRASGVCVGVLPGGCGSTGCCGVSEGEAI